MAFKQGNNIGAATRFQPGQSGNPGGRPKGMAAIAHKVMAEAVAEGDMTRAEALVRKLFELAMEGNVQAIKLLLDREWPAPNRYDRSNDEVPLLIIKDFTGEHHEHCQERLLPSTVDDPPEATSEPTVRAPDAPEASGWEVRRPGDEDRETTAVF